jgi:hypothetical protein
VHYHRTQNNPLKSTLCPLNAKTPAKTEGILHFPMKEWLAIGFDFLIRQLVIDDRKLHVAVFSLQYRFEQSSKYLSL